MIKIYENVHICRRGFTMLELIVGIIVFAVISTAIIYTFRFMIITRLQNERKITASQVARVILEHETLKSFNQVGSIVRTPVASAQICSTPDADGQTPLACAVQSGVSNAYRNTALSDMEFEVIVTCLVESEGTSNIDAWPLEGGTGVCTSSSDYKRIDIRLIGPQLGTFQIRSVVANVDGF